MEENTEPDSEILEIKAVNPFYGEYRRAWAYAVITILILWLILSIVTLGVFLVVSFLLTLILVGVVLVYRYTCKPKIDNTLRFDNRDRLMYSALYDPIPYNKLKIKPILRRKRGISPAEWYLALYAEGVEPKPISCWYAFRKETRTRPQFTKV
jgi:uncharacterized membrane protein